MFRTAGIIGIRFYQKFLSPIKGYSCAYATYTGSLSCSQYGLKAVEKKGVWIGYKLIKQRFKKCAYASQELKKIPKGWRKGNAVCAVTQCGCMKAEESCCG